VVDISSTQAQWNKTSWLWRLLIRLPCCILITKLQLTTLRFPRLLKCNYRLDTEVTLLPICFISVTACRIHSGYINMLNWVEISWTVLFPNSFDMTWISLTRNKFLTKKCCTRVCGIDTNFDLNKNFKYPDSNWQTV